jgi:anti-sigma B factor antagonist
VDFDPAKLTIDDERLDEQTLVVAASGEIHLSTAPKLAERLAGAVAGDAKAVVIDLSAVTFIDSTGLGMLLEAQRRANQNNSALALVVANPTVLRLFEITRLDTTFAIEPTLAAALDRLRADVAG